MAHLCVFAKHPGEQKEYIFAVVPPMEVRKGDVLLVETMRGRDVAIATTEMFESRNVDEIAQKFGAYLPLKNVVQVCGKEMQSHFRIKYRRETAADIIEELKNKFVYEIPF